MTKPAMTNQPSTPKPPVITIAELREGTTPAAQEALQILRQNAVTNLLFNTTNEDEPKQDSQER